MNKRIFSKNYLLTVFSATLFYTASFMVNSVCGRYTLEIGGSKTTAGIIAAVFTVTSFFARPVWGYCSDKYSRRRVYISGGILSFAASVLLLFADKIWVLTASRGIFGMGYSALTTSGGTIVCDIVPEKFLGKAISFYGITNVLSQAIAPAAALWLFDIGFAWVAWVVLAVIAMVVAVSVFIKYDEKKFISSSAEFRIYEKTAIPAAFVILFFAAAMASVYSFIPVMAQERQIEHTGIFFAASAAGLMFSRIFNAKFCEKFGETKVFMTGDILFTAGFVVRAFSYNIWFLTLAALLYGTGGGFVHPVVNTAAVKRCTADKRGLATGTFMMSQDLGMTIGAALWGLISEKAGFTAVYLAVGATAVLMMIAFRKCLVKILN